MGLADTFGAEDRVQVKFSDFYKLMKQATQYEIAMNAVGCDVPHRYIRECMTGVKEPQKQGIQIELENPEVLVKMEEQGDTVVVSVKDSGCGIDEEGQQKLLHTDTHFSTFGTNNEEGSGLGLLLCQDFAVKIGGKLWFTSKEGEGSTFYFSIPLKK